MTEKTKEPHDARKAVYNELKEKLSYFYNQYGDITIGDAYKEYLFDNVINEVLKLGNGIHTNQIEILDSLLRIVNTRNKSFGRSYDVRLSKYSFKLIQSLITLFSVNKKIFSRNILKEYQAQDEDDIINFAGVSWDLRWKDNDILEKLKVFFNSNISFGLDKMEVLSVYAFAQDLFNSTNRANLEKSINYLSNKFFFYAELDKIFNAYKNKKANENIEIDLGQIEKILQESQNKDLNYLFLLEKLNELTGVKFIKTVPPINDKEQPNQSVEGRQPDAPAGGNSVSSHEIKISDIIDKNLKNEVDKIDTYKTQPENEGNNKDSVNEKEKDSEISKIDSLNNIKMEFNKLINEYKTYKAENYSKLNSEEINKFRNKIVDFLNKKNIDENNKAIQDLILITNILFNKEIDESQLINNNDLINFKNVILRATNISSLKTIDMRLREEGIKTNLLEVFQNEPQVVQKLTKLYSDVLLKNLNYSGTEITLNPDISYFEYIEKNLYDKLSGHNKIKLDENLEPQIFNILQSGIQQRQIELWQQQQLKNQQQQQNQTQEQPKQQPQQQQKTQNESVGQTQNISVDNKTQKNSSLNGASNMKGKMFIKFAYEELPRIVPIDLGDDDMKLRIDQRIRDRLEGALRSLEENFKYYNDDGRFTAMIESIKRLQEYLESKSYELIPAIKEFYKDLIEEEKSSSNKDVFNGSFNINNIIDIISGFVKTIELHEKINKDKKIEIQNKNDIGENLLKVREIDTIAFEEAIKQIVSIFVNSLWPSDITFINNKILTDKKTFTPNSGVWALDTTKDTRLTVPVYLTLKFFNAKTVTKAKEILMNGDVNQIIQDRIYKELNKQYNMKKNELAEKILEKGNKNDIAKILTEGVRGVNENVAKNIMKDIGMKNYANSSVLVNSLDAIIKNKIVSDLKDKIKQIDFKDFIKDKKISKENIVNKIIEEIKLPSYITDLKFNDTRGADYNIKEKISNELEAAFKNVKFGIETLTLNVNSLTDLERKIYDAFLYIYSQNKDDFKKKIFNILKNSKNKGNIYEIYKIFNNNGFNLIDDDVEKIISEFRAISVPIDIKRLNDELKKDIYTEFAKNILNKGVDWSSLIKSIAARHNVDLEYINRNIPEYSVANIVAASKTFNDEMNNNPNVIYDSSASYAILQDLVNDLKNNKLPDIANKIKEKIELQNLTKQQEKYIKPKEDNMNSNS